MKNLILAILSFILLFGSLYDLKRIDTLVVYENTNNNDVVYEIREYFDFRNSI